MSVEHCGMIFVG